MQLVASVVELLRRQVALAFDGVQVPGADLIFDSIWLVIS